MFRPRDLGEWLALALVCVASVSVIAGFVLIGGPGAARAEKQDAARMNAIADLADAFACYRRHVGPLPGDLSIVREAVETPTSPLRLGEACGYARWADDPVTGDAFVVENVMDQTAQICAVFDRPDRQAPNPLAYRYAGRAVLIDADQSRPEAGLFCYTAKLTKTDP